jgi:uncharacterized protein YjbI with pentapeptide repeats
MTGGVRLWNQWRKQNPTLRPDLRGADLRRLDLSRTNFSNADLSKAKLSRARLSSARLRGANLSKTDLYEASLHGADLREANLCGANLHDASLGLVKAKGADLSRAYVAGANLNGADLRGADLHGANLYHAQLFFANLSGSNLSKAKLSEANLMGANLSSADLRGANLSMATLIDTNLEGADLTGSSVFGISVWAVKLEGAIQSNLVITPRNESPIQVDNLEVAQFIYLLLNNEKLRSVIDTITSKVVLILGRFTPDRKVILEAIREEIRKRGYLPVLFDFEKPASKDLTGTVSTLANMARFIIADLTDPNSVPHELATVIPSTVVPVQAIVLKGRRAYPMFADLKRRHHWVLKPYQYKSKDLLIDQLSERVIAPAEAKARALARGKD